MKDWTQPTPVDDVLLAFPGTVKHLMPSWEEIPAKYKDDCHPCVGRFCELFYRGGKIEARDGIDQNTAARHLKAVMGSYEPKHEHKIAACAMFLDLWFSPT